MIKKIGFFFKFNNTHEEYSAYKYFIKLTFDLIKQNNEKIIRMPHGYEITTDKSKYNFVQYPACGERVNKTYVDTILDEEFINSVIIPFLKTDNLKYSDIFQNIYYVDLNDNEIKITKRIIQEAEKELLYDNEEMNNMYYNK